MQMLNELQGKTNYSFRQLRTNTDPTLTLTSFCSRLKTHITSFYYGLQAGS